MDAGSVTDGIKGALVGTSAEEGLDDRRGAISIDAADGPLDGSSEENFDGARDGSSELGADGAREGTLGESIIGTDVCSVKEEGAADRRVLTPHDVFEGLEDGACDKDVDGL